jgi:hypothetical protein
MDDCSPGVLACVTVTDPGEPDPIDPGLGFGGFGSFSPSPPLEGNDPGPGNPVSSNPCDPRNPTNTKVINFIQNNSAAAQTISSATGLSAAFILAWGAYESGFGVSGQATVNNNFFGLTGSGWSAAVNCPANATAGFACFQYPGMAQSGLSALLSFNDQYLNAALAAQAAGGNTAAIANAIAAAGYNSEYQNGGYGANVAGAAQAIASRQNCP